ncbi:hypothetical protein Anapl_10361 [Anas platyrhynchos]|uniref:Uncharacterized protein n=1 Tax=Anas platyrhynchos TaxID=8839 RepID=R0KCL9_ANAPL|nr:hypothetical protein Anapl_10361 [Anas platyrhynchos]
MAKSACRQKGVEEKAAPPLPRSEELPPKDNGQGRAGGIRQGQPAAAAGGKAAVLRFSTSTAASLEMRRRRNVMVQRLHPLHNTLCSDGEAAGS